MEKNRALQFSECGKNGMKLFNMIHGSLRYTKNISFVMIAKKRKRKHKKKYIRANLMGKET